MTTEGRPKQTSKSALLVANAPTLVLAILLGVALYDRNVALGIIAIAIPAGLIAAGIAFFVLRLQMFKIQIIRFILQQRDVLKNPKSYLYRFYLALLASLGGKKPKLYAFQSALPHLPVPDLHKTLQKYLRSVQPLLTESEYQTTEQVVKEFEQTTGPKLQQMLLERRKEKDNWIEEWWENFVYLSNREPLVPYTSYYGTDRIDALDIPQIKRLANIIRLTMMFKQLVDSEELEPIRVLNIVPLCMHQYSRLFSTCRVPTDPTDKIVCHSSENPKHIVVLRNFRIFKLDVFHEGKLLSTQELEKQLLSIVEQSETEDPHPVGVLTSENRSVWAKLREQLIAEGNQEALHTVESALYAVCLEDTAPHTLEEVAHTGLIGNSRNRWYDKSFQVIMFQNGRLGSNVEHSWADAPIVVHLFDYVFGLEGSNIDEDTVVRDLPPPQQLQWKISPSVQQAIAAAFQKTDYVAANVVDIKILLFDHFGKGLIKQFKVSPDGFVQMALQLAYYRLHGKTCLTYESAHTRQFYHGRTETVRTCSNESLAFCKAMVGPDSKQYTQKDRLDLLRKAIDQHLRYMKDAMEGEAVDRHMFGLRIVSLGAGLTLPIFTDKAWKFDYQLSTSQTPAHQTTGGGFSPTAKDGYGVSYVVSEDRLTFHISTYKGSTETSGERFANMLTEVLLQMRSLELATPKMRHSLSRGKLSPE